MRVRSRREARPGVGAAGGTLPIDAPNPVSTMFSTSRFAVHPAPLCGLRCSTRELADALIAGGDDAQLPAEWARAAPPSRRRS